MLRASYGSITAPSWQLPVTESVALPPDQGMHHMPQPNTRPEPSLIPIERPRCPQCSNRMSLAMISPASEGYDSRTFECAKCNHTMTRTVARDPMSDRSGWQYSELKAPE